MQNDCLELSDYDIDKAEYEASTNLIHSIAMRTGIAEPVVKKAAFAAADNYPADRVTALEDLCLFISDGQEQREIVKEFRRQVLLAS